MKKIISILTIVVFMLSLMQLTVASTEIASNGVSTIQMGKIEPDVRAMIQEQSEMNPAGELRVVVVLDESAGKAEALSMLDDLGATINAEHGIVNAISASVPAQNVATLTGLGDVQKILLDEKRYGIPPYTDGDPDYPELRGNPPEPQSDDSGIAWDNYMSTDPYWYSQFPWWIEADKVWVEGITGEDVTLAILDTGIFYEHPDLDGVVIDYEVFTSEVDVFPHDGYGHGTACAGIVASQAIVAHYGFLKVKGVAPGSKILGGKVLTDAGWGWDSWIIEGIEWAVESGADIISMSLGGLEIPNDGNDPTALALDAATAQGVTSFVAAGNSAGQSTVGSAGCGKSVITVGASTENSEEFYVLGYWPMTFADGYENDQMIFWSSEGPTADGRTDPDVSAIGAWGWTLDTDPWWIWLQFGGTSMATPVAAGVGALVIEAYRATHGGMSPSPELVKSILMGTAKDLGYPANKQGAGRVDAYQAYLAAISTRSYPDKPSIDTEVVHPGDSYYETIEFTKPIDSVTTAKFATVEVLEIEELSGKVGDDVFAYFTAPAETEYVVVKLKFDPEVCFGPVQDYDGSQWTDAHINPTLYRIDEDGYWIMLNYAYAHTNTQWFTARATPGDYALWFGVLGYGVPPDTPITFDVQVTFMRQVSWDWITTDTDDDEMEIEISVPECTSPGPYSGFIKVISGGDPITIPVTITVPAELCQEFTWDIHVANEPRDSISGDWKYFVIDVDFPRWRWFGPITVTVSWTNPDSDFDVYLIAPDGEAEALSRAPNVPTVLPSGGGRYHWTTTGEKTMEMLSVGCARQGYWLVGVRNIFFGNMFTETITVHVTEGKPMEEPCLIMLRPGKTRTFAVSNNIGGSLDVETMVLSYKMETFCDEYEGTVHSVNFTEGHVGYDWWVIPVTPDITVLKVSIDWEGTEELQLTLYDPAGANRGRATKGDKIIICDPTIGYWEAIITIHVPDTAIDYTLKVGGLRFKAFEGVTLEPATFTLDPYGTQTLTITAEKKGFGFIVFYNLDTGSIYSKTILTVYQWRY